MTSQKQIRTKKSIEQNRKEKSLLVLIRAQYITVLKNELEKRRAINFHYSLRAFARELELDPIHLSRILNNKKGLSPRKAEGIARKLHLNFSERRRFRSLVSAASARSKLTRNLAAYGLKNKAYLKHAGAAACAVAV